MARWLKFIVWGWLLLASVFTVVVQIIHLEEGIGPRWAFIAAAAFTAAFAIWQLRKLWLGLPAL